MVRLEGVKEFKVRLEKAGNQVLIGTADRQAAALFRTRRGKACNQHEAAGPDHTPEHIGVGKPIRTFGQKVQNGPVMPQIKTIYGLPFCDIDSDEAQTARFAAQPLPYLCQGHRGNIQHRDIREALCQEGIRKSGSAGANINNASIQPQPAGLGSGARTFLACADTSSPYCQAWLRTRDPNAPGEGPPCLSPCGVVTRAFSLAQLGFRAFTAMA
jgi:hypothetical protein